MRSWAPQPATEKDARLHKIPDHYCLGQWDPNEKPITFLGHVFDTNSLGKWIFDWTAQIYGGGSSVSDIAGDLWLLILHLPGMLRLSYEFLKGSTGTSFEDLGNYEMMRDFIEAGDHLMERLQRFLRDYEEPVSEALDEKELGESLVDIVFDHEGDLARTEALIYSIRLWNLRWDANCADVVKKSRVGHS